MEEFLLLSQEQRQEFEPMIPQWLLDMEAEGEEVEFWGMVSFDSPSGVAVLTTAGTQMRLLYLYVAEAFRGVGRGSAFLLELLFHARQAGCESFVTSYIPEQYPDFEKLLKPYDFQIEEEAVGTFSCSMRELMQISQLQGAYRSVRPLSECSEQSLQSLYKAILEEGERLVELPLKKREYLVDCCAVALEENKPAGILLVKQVSDQEVTIPLIVNYSHNVLAMLEMMRFALQAGSRVFSPETRCCFDVVNDTLLQLLEKLGIRAVAKRQRCTLDLSFLEKIEWEVQEKIFEELITTDYVYEGLGKIR